MFGIPHFGIKSTRARGIAGEPVIDPSQAPEQYLAAAIRESLGM
jgi:hypothetical protein